ncbi:type IV secretion system protein VirB10 [Methylotenera sp.]|uniref:type IV secretion system protein VirB10 n=1 Tax=Methylotenera sp. TaxID=2051956 RepID=UPI0027364CF0|nr:type IV secretion system protein VirB10 [Methylotenera sp.]MDP3004695.1 type IV secretion system protein VirB10 [Methylotenera sp.]
MTNTIEHNDKQQNSTDEMGLGDESHKTSIDQAYTARKNWGAMLFMLAIPLLFGSAGYFAYSRYQAHLLTSKAEQKSHKFTAENTIKPMGVEGEGTLLKPAEMQGQTTPMPDNANMGVTPIGVIPNNQPMQHGQTVTVKPNPSPSRYDAAILPDQGESQLAVATGTVNQGLYNQNTNNSRVARPLSQEVETEGTFDRSARSNPDGMQLTPTYTPKTKARLLGNRNYVLAKGNEFDCALNTAINSSNPGMVTCTTTSNSYSDNGKVVLVERGSLLTGEYTGLKHGDTRLRVLWDRIKTPEGVVIALDSLGTDALGRGGFDGDVDKHWLERIGSAFLMSSFKDLVAYETVKNSNASSNIASASFSNTQSAGNDLASQVLKQSINIPPTLTKNQGERVAIVVARDLDFSEVYQLEANDSMSVRDKQ